MRRRGRQWRDGPARRRPRRTPILLGLFRLAHRGPWCTPLAAGLAICVLCSLVFPWFVSVALSMFGTGELGALVDRLSGRPVRAFSLLGLVAFVVGLTLSAWRFLFDRAPAPTDRSGSIDVL